MRDDMAERLAEDIGHIRDVKKAVVQAGETIAASGSAGGPAGRTAALARFLLARGEAAAHQGDLRGLGRMLADSKLTQAAFAGPGGEGLLLCFDEGWALVSFERGTNTEAAGAAVRAAARRYGGLHELAGAA